MDERTILKQNPEKDFNYSLLSPAIKGINLSVSKKSNLDGPTTPCRLCLETGRHVATLVHKISTVNHPVKKVADTQQGDSNAHNQNGMQHNENNEMVDDAGQPNNRNTGGNNNGENGNENDNNDDIFNDEDIEFVDGSDNEEGEGENGIQVSVYMFNVNVDNWIAELEQIIVTNIVANSFENWQDLSHVIHHVYLDMGGVDDDNNDDVPINIEDLNPYNCWPGCWTTFALMYDNGSVYPVNSDMTPLQDIKSILNGFLVYTPVYDG